MGPAGGTMGRVTRGSSPVLVGREIELVRLRDALSIARSSDRSVVLVSGEAGIGKSRLLADFEAGVTADPPGDRPVRFLYAGCIEVGERLAYLPILDWLAELRTSDDPDAGVGRGRTSGNLRRHHPDRRAGYRSTPLVRDEAVASRPSETC